MLKQLTIKNYALIQHLELVPSPNFNIITGETGAGKSIILGAIGLLLGNRADTKVLFDENEKCSVEAVFDLSAYNLERIFKQEELDFENDCIIRRDIATTGKSRAFINDTPVNLETLKIISTQLLDIHSQHDTLLLGKEEYQLSLLDTFAQNQAIVELYQNSFKRFKKTEAELNKLETLKENSQKENDFESFLLKELVEANLKVNEQEEFESELITIENAEDIKSKLHFINQALSESEYAINTQLTVVLSTAEKLSAFGETYEKIKERVKQCQIELKDIAREYDRKEAQVEFDPERAEFLKQRLDVIFALQKKHRVQTVNELIEIQEQLSTKLAGSLNIDEDIEKLKKQYKDEKDAVSALAEKLSHSRLLQIETLENQIKELLSFLAMPNAILKLEHQIVSAGITGIDSIKFMFSANKGFTLQELKNAASGGEFSRLMLCIKYMLAQKTHLPTIIFDEIDTGISGEVAIKVAKMIKKMSAAHQVLTITHLPQMASYGDRHYYVFKEDQEHRTVSTIRELSMDERIKELAQMIGGENPSSSAFESAKEMLVNV